MSARRSLVSIVCIVLAAPGGCDDKTYVPYEPTDSETGETPADRDDPGDGQLVVDDPAEPESELEPEPEREESPERLTRTRVLVEQVGSRLRALFVPIWLMLLALALFFISPVAVVTSAL